MKITIYSRPEMGNIQRYCSICTEPYQGWNFVMCPECESMGMQVTVIEAWR